MSQSNRCWHSAEFVRQWRNITTGSEAEVLVVFRRCASRTCLQSVQAVDAQYRKGR